MTNTISINSEKLESSVLAGLTATFAFGLACFAYLGIFARHLADDYCIADLLHGNFWVNLWNNYLTVSDRFSNYIFIAASEIMGPWSAMLLPAILLISWTVGLAWFLKEANQWTGQNWPIAMRLVLALTVVFFTILQAPNRYQTLYWRASSAAHLVPLVVMPFLFSYLSLSIRNSIRKPTSAWTYLFLFLCFFLVGDFAEPSNALLIILLGICITSFWIWKKEPGRKQALYLLGWSFAGTAIALLVMALSPANSLRLGTPPPPISILIIRSLRYTYEFILESLRIRPLPTMISFLVPLLIFFNRYTWIRPVWGQEKRNLFVWLLFIIPALAFLLIVASFSPSVYGQGYPLERARISGTFIYVISCMVEGALLGSLTVIWFPRIVENKFARWTAVLLLIAATLYPLRTGWLTLAELPEYRERAQAWDVREAYIRDLIAQGSTDLLIPQMDGIFGVKEMDVSAEHWINKCAASYYNVNSIRAIPPDDG